MLCNHGALIAVERDGRLMKGLFRMPQLVVELRHATFENGAEVPRNQRPTDGYKKKDKKTQVICETSFTQQLLSNAYCIASVHPRGKRLKLA